MNDADRKVKALYQAVRPDNVESSVAQARKLAPDLTEEGQRFLEALLALHVGLKVVGGRSAQLKDSDAKSRLWRMAALLSLLGLGAAALVERLLVGEGQRRWYDGAIGIAVFVLVTGGLFVAARFYLRSRRLRGRR